MTLMGADSIMALMKLGGAVPPRGRGALGERRHDATVVVAGGHPGLPKYPARAKGWR